MITTIKPVEFNCTVRKSLACVIILFCSNVAMGQELLFSLTQSSISGFSTNENNQSQSIAFSTTDSDSLAVGEQIGVTLPDGTVANGFIASSHTDQLLNSTNMAASDETKVISISPGVSVDIHSNRKKIVGITMSDLGSQTFHRATINDSGQGTLLKENTDDYLCATYPDLGQQNQVQFSDIDPAEIPSINTVRNLQSNPGATNVIYIDYWGGTLSGSAWASGQTINYEPYSIDAASSFNGTELYLMYQAWAEIAEDYAPFDVNVTTRQAIFDSTVNSRKSRIIASTRTTRDQYNLCNNCGGVAYLNVYGGSTLYQTGWTFNSTLSSMGQTHSHEAGHQMGLLHDGNPPLTYYSGHGEWGPIMGAPFGKRYVQWSKGDYPNADRFEDDFSIIGSKLGTLSDDVGNNAATAEPLGDATDIIRKITPMGAVGQPDNDSDYFRFSIAANGGSIDLQIGPRLGLDTVNTAAGESTGANLSLEAQIWKSGESQVIRREVPQSPLRPNTNQLLFNGPLDQGNYILRVARKSPDTNWTTGFDEWGNGGSYRVKLTVNNNPLQQCNGQTVTVDLSAGDLPTSGDDVILGTTGNDTINAGDGHDTICALAGNDTIDGGDGSDWIDGSAGRDTIFGGAGSDRIYGGTDSDTIHGGAGDDRLYGQGDADILNGNTGDDRIYGGQNNDRIDGGHGDDRIWGETGNDLILGGLGNDSWLDGGDHNDRVSGQGGDDVVRGGDGRDEIFGGPGDDDIRAQSGNDILTDGGQGTDQCQVAPGIDAAPVNCE